MLSDADVELLGKLQLNQSCNWRSNLAYQTDFAQREAAAGNASALEHVDANNFPPIPPRFGPSTLPRSIGITHLVDSEDDEEPNDTNSETSKAAGKKRAAPDGHGKAATGGKKPKTK
ncbi:hypothetical protein FPRO04_04865 [Fusarium proliferatum]|nr:hypothetical protein FPRO04_04865 [Fusarium proliferatum]